MPFVYVALATAQYSPCLFEHVTIGLVRHNRTHVSQSEHLLVKPQRPFTDLCTEPVGVWNRLVRDREDRGSRGGQNKFPLKRKLASWSMIQYFG